MTASDTIAAIATAPGRGGVAVIRVSGPEAFAVAERLTGIGDQGSGIRVRKLYAPDHSSLLDECLVLVFKSPHSYTGEDVVEFQCHGGTVTPRRILEACFAAGARLARRGEFTERAFLNGRLTYEQAEGVLDLIDAKTERAADAALEGLAGARQKEIRRLYARALEVSSTAEHALDVSEDELPADFVRTLKLQIFDIRTEISEEIKRLKAGKILREGACVVLAGAPNAGKSSLMNALLRENRAIVSDIPGTTRDFLEEWVDIEGWPVRLVDTAGLREEKAGGGGDVDVIEREGIARARELMAKADLVLFLSASDNPNTSNIQTPKHPSVLSIHSKSDLGRGPGLNVSAKTGEGLEALRAAIAAELAARAAESEEASGGDRDVAGLQRILSDLSGVADESDLVLVANRVRMAAESLGDMVGATYSADLLDALFSRFCVGK